MIKRSIGDKIFDLINTLFMLFMIVITIYPIIYVALASISDSNLLLAHSGLLYKPLGFNLDSYKEVFKNPMILVGFENTLFYVFVGTAISMVITIMGAYALSRKQLWIRKYINLLVVVTMFFSGGLIPMYLLVKNIGLYDSRWALILPTAINTYNMIVMRTAFSGFPTSLEEAAKIDGANDFQILIRIVIPLTTATIAVILLFYAVARWNDWFQASIYLRTREKYPIQLYLREVLIYSSTDSMQQGAAAGQDAYAIGESIKYSTVMVSTLPILIVYPFLQKYFVKGVMVGAVKG